jgi:hypothetical protein
MRTVPARRIERNRCGTGVSTGEEMAEMARTCPRRNTGGGSRKAAVRTSAFAKLPSTIALGRSCDCAHLGVAPTSSRWTHFDESMWLALVTRASPKKSFFTSPGFLTLLPCRPRPRGHPGAGCAGPQRLPRLFPSHCYFRLLARRLYCRKAMYFREMPGFLHSNAAPLGQEQWGRARTRIHHDSGQKLRRSISGDHVLLRRSRLHRGGAV